MVVNVERESDQNVKIIENERKDRLIRKTWPILKYSWIHYHYENLFFY